MSDSPKFKPLQWRLFMGAFVADAIYVQYQIAFTEEQGGEVYMGRLKLCPCDSIEHGKELAEADWQERLAEVLI